MGYRNGDVRIYLIYLLFFACTVAGGVFLCMYLIYPDSTFVYYYLVAGMTMVTIPWFFWFLIYIYRCFKPMDDQFGNPRVGASKNRALTKLVTNPGVGKAPDGGGGHPC